MALSPFAAVLIEGSCVLIVTHLCDGEACAMIALTQLPPEMIADIARSLDASELCRFMLTCKKVHQSVMAGHVHLDVFCEAVEEGARHGKIDSLKHYIKKYGVNTRIQNAVWHSLTGQQTACFEFLACTVHPSEDVFLNGLYYCVQPLNFIESPHAVVRVVFELFQKERPEAFQHCRLHGVFEKCKLRLFKKERLEVMEVFLEKGALNVDDLLNDACYYGHLDTVQLAYRYGGNVNPPPLTDSQVDRWEDIPLINAVCSNNLEIIDWLVDHGTHDHKDDALVCACKSWSTSLEVVQRLIRHGASVNANDGEPLLWACRNHNEECVEVLLQHGALVSRGGLYLDAVFDSRYTPFPYSNTTLARIAEKLLDHGEDINARQGQLFINACIHQSVPTVKMLIARGVDVTVRNYEVFSYEETSPELHTVLMEAVGGKAPMGGSLQTINIRGTMY